VAHRVDPLTSVELVLAVDDLSGLAQAASSWLTQPHPNWKIVLAAPPGILADATAALTTTGIAESRITTITTTADNPAAALAAAADAATADTSCSCKGLPWASPTTG